MTKKTTSANKTDLVTGWLNEANEEFFGRPSAVEASTVRKALTGMVVFVIGVGVILWQVL